MKFVLIPQLPVRVQLLALAVALSVSASSAGADDVQMASPTEQPTTTLVTHLGDRLPGHWLATDNLKTIAWQAEGFVQPFRFAREQLSAIQIRHKTEVPRIMGTYRCELTNGDVLYGTPLAIDDTELVFKLPDSGPLRIERSRLHKLSPWSDAGQGVSSTPTSLSDWQGTHAAWQEAGGRITALQENAELTTSLRLGNKSQTSIRIAWTGRPDFRIDFGSSDKWTRGLRLETWQDQLVFVAESSLAADVLLVKEVNFQSDELLLHVFVDTEQQTILVADENNETLGEFVWQENFKRSFRILARKSGFHFYSATVTPWDGSSPDLLQPAQSTVRYKSGETDNATITAWDAEKKEWTLAIEASSPASEPTERKVPNDEIEAFFFAGEPPAGDPSAGDIEQSQDSVQVVSRTGMRFTGEIAKLTDHAVELRCRGFKEPFSLNLASLRSLVFLQKPIPADKKSARFPRIQIGDASIVGQLVAGKRSDTATALVWKPSASQTAAAVSPPASGTITYREPPPPIEKPKASPVQSNTGLVGGLVRLFASAGARSRTATTTASSSPEPTLYLRSGDSIPCQPKRIDRDGVTFNSPVTEATFAPHEKIKALVLVGNFQPAQVTEAQRDRLLTLPRIQQEYPPTHLLLSVDGDLLRTRVTAMDDKFITSEVRLNPVNLPRERVAAIAWLHQDEQEEEKEDKPSANSSAPVLQVQAVQSDGIRLTFRPQEYVENALLGKSDVFGNCRVEVSQVDKFLFGQAIFDALEHQSHQLLTLKPAIAPRFVTADSSAPTNVGQGSALVGLEAPPIKLKDLTGSKFDLTDLRGKVVILDFWATWCGPCIQWMPQLEELVANYSDEEVELITINLLQEKEMISPALERMQISPTVLLDLDGVVADAYQATAIPQTVIIDQQGKIARLFIGGSPQIKQPMIEALDELTSNPAAN